MRQVRRILGLVPGDEYDDRAVVEVRAEQARAGLVVDDVVGPKTWDHLVARAGALGIDDDVFGRLSLERVDLPGAAAFLAANGEGSTYLHHTMRSDAAAAWRAVVDVVGEVGGTVTSAGAMRQLDAEVTASRSATSGHYLGRDVDLALGSGMHRPDRDPFVVTRAPELGKRRWRVWARCASDGPGVRVRTVAAVVWGRPGTVSVTARMLDLTALASSHGFVGVPARASSWWPEGATPVGSYPGAEWWHLGWRGDLVRGETTFGDELLRVYSPGQLRGTPPWEHRHLTYGVEGGWW